VARLILAILALLAIIALGYLLLVATRFSA
jgi:hypothetical protein